MILISTGSISNKISYRRGSYFIYFGKTRPVLKVLEWCFTILRKDIAANVLTVVPVIATEISIKANAMRPQELSNSLRVSAQLKDGKTYPLRIHGTNGIFTYMNG